MAKAVADDYLRRIPKAELHCHLAGTLRAATVAELAKRAGLALPRPADKLYQWPDFYGFLDVLRLTALVLRTPADFARAVYEYVEDAVRGLEIIDAARDSARQGAVTRPRSPAA